MGPRGVAIGCVSFFAVPFVGLAVAAAVLSSLAYFNSPPKSTSSFYTIQLNLTQMDVSKVFGAASGTSLADAHLNPYYQFGIFGYCSGDFDGSKLISANCSKSKGNYKINIAEALLADVNPDILSNASMISSDIMLPVSLPSQKKINTKSLNLYRGLIVGVSFAIMTVSCAFVGFTGLILGLWNGVSEDDYLFGSACLVAGASAYAVTTIWSLISWISLCVSAAASKGTFEDIADAFNKETEYGITASFGHKLWKYIYAAMACELVYWFFYSGTSSNKNTSQNQALDWADSEK